MFSETAAAVELVQVSKRFGAAWAVHALNLQVRAGELVALLGPNGAGKSTAISLMLGLRRPTFGTVRVAGHDPSDARARASVGALLQSTGLPRALRVVEVLNLFRSFHSAPFSGSALLELTGLEAKARHWVASLSAGERQRLLFAIAIAGNPPILILDEPSVFMDIEARAQFRSLARELVGRGRSIILTTHFPEEAEAVADRVVIMSQGTVAACGTARHIKQIAGRERLEDAVATLTGQAMGAHP